MSDKSLYRYILEAVTLAMENDEIPNVSLPPDTSSPVPFADGARDGIMMYHMGMHDITDEARELMEKALRTASDGDIEAAERLFIELGKKTSALSLIDELQKYIVLNEKELSLNNLCDFAVYAIMNSADRECVKFGLSILELVDIEDNEDVKNAVIMLGRSDEFSLFSIFIMSHWRDGNSHIVLLATETRGWGRIHAIDRIEPNAENIRNWLLREGVHNTVLPAYSALNCWEKSGAAELLMSGAEFSDEEFRGLRDIMTALLDEGPCAGISEVKNADEMLIKFLNLASGRELDEDDLKAIQTIKANCEEKADIVALCDEILG